MSNRIAAVVHDKIADGARKDELDNLLQARAVKGSLERLGYEAVCLPFCLNELDLFTSKLRSLKPLFAFNLVEALHGNSPLCFMACTVLEGLGVRYTGNSAYAVFTTTNKVISKKMLQGFGLNTPEWVEYSGEGKYLAGKRYILKPVCEEGSVGIYDSSLVICKSRDELLDMIRSETNASGREYFAERYIDGREFAISMMGSVKEGPRLLPVAEILFEGYEERGLPKIVNYDAKWNPDSYMYRHTTRSYPDSEKDTGMISMALKAAEKCWRLFGLKGYARIDFKMDTNGTPWIIDINTNPCLSAGSGFLDAAIKAGFDFDGVIACIIEEVGNPLSISLS